jgi:hypothetical protein
MEDRGSISGRGWGFCPLHRFQTGSGNHSAYYPMGIGGSKVLETMVSYHITTRHNQEDCDLKSSLPRKPQYRISSKVSEYNKAFLKYNTVSYMRIYFTT